LLVMWTCWWFNPGTRGVNLGLWDHTLLVV
jgi:hypothetical protein